jgi:hypothetical protein
MCRKSHQDSRADCDFQTGRGRVWRPQAAQRTGGTYRVDRRLSMICELGVRRFRFALIGGRGGSIRAPRRPGRGRE